MPYFYHPDEANGFLRAIEHGILEVNDIGKCGLPNLHRIKTKPTEASLLNNNNSSGAIRMVWREYITQVGATASLIIDYGYPQNRVALDPGDWKFDIAVYPDSTNPDAHIYIAGETKKSERELKKTMSEMLTACRQAIPPDTITKKNDGQKKYEGMLVNKPLYFWAVAPGLRTAYQVDYDQSRVSMRRMDDLPKYE